VKTVNCILCLKTYKVLIESKYKLCLYCRRNKESCEDGHLLIQPHRSRYWEIVGDEVIEEVGSLRLYSKKEYLK